MIDMLILLVVEEESISIISVNISVIDSSASVLLLFFYTSLDHSFG